MADAPLHPLVSRLIADYAYRYIDDAEGDGAPSAEASLLFLPAHGKAHLETPDIAIVLPELARALQLKTAGAVASPAFERRMQEKLGGVTLPAIVVMRAGEPVGSISRMRDWDEYLERLSALLDAPAPANH